MMHWSLLYSEQLTSKVCNCYVNIGEYHTATHRDVHCLVGTSCLTNCWSFCWVVWQIESEANPNENLMMRWAGLSIWHRSSGRISVENQGCDALGNTVQQVFLNPRFCHISTMSLLGPVWSSRVASLLLTRLTRGWELLAPCCEFNWPPQNRSLEGAEVELEAPGMER